MKLISDRLNTNRQISIILHTNSFVLDNVLGIFSFRFLSVNQDFLKQNEKHRSTICSYSFATVINLDSMNTLPQLSLTNAQNQC